MQIRSLKQQGSILLESLIAILIFSLGILSLVALLGASVKDTASAGYRMQASLLASQVIGQMWTGDKSNTALVENYTGTGAPYADWQDKVAAALPGVDTASATTAPTIVIDGNNNVTVTVHWQAPGESGSPHKYVATARIDG
jgi:type IV pilus assembly protein PilV